MQEDTMRNTTRTLSLIALALACAAILKAQPRSAGTPFHAQSPAATTAADASASTMASADFTGDWSLDPDRSDLPQMRGGMRGQGGGNGSFGGRHEDGQGQGRPGGSRPGRLPARFHITQTADLLSFEDSSGAVIQQIVTTPSAADTSASVRQRQGVWKSGSLELVRSGRGGSKVVETWSLADHGASLVAMIHFEGGDMGARTIKRVYRRVNES
jgi:hypothetical protein